MLLEHIFTIKHPIKIHTNGYRHHLRQGWLQVANYLWENEYKTWPSKKNDKIKTSENINVSISDLARVQ